VSIYTKKGDRGKTSTIDKKPVSKESALIEAIGAIDELNTYLGLAMTFCQNRSISELLINTQKDLFRVGSILAGSKLSFPPSKVRKLENKIDELDSNLKPLSNFILVGGTRCSAHLQYSRSLARRAERQVVNYAAEKKLNPQVLKYLNRLSDFLFTLARWDNHQNGVAEEPWVGRRK